MTPVVFTHGNGFAVLILPDGKFIQEPVIHQVFVPDHDRTTRGALIEACLDKARAEGFAVVQGMDQSGREQAFTRLFGRYVGAVEKVGTVYRFHLKV